jgi:hypothetical protein
MKLRSVPHKYGAKPCKRGQLKFDSILERKVWDLLESLRNSGKILFTLRQVSIDIPSGKHHVDFLTFTTDGNAYFIEAKGRDLDAGRVRRLTSEDKLGVEIHVVTDPVQVFGVIASP